MSDQADLSRALIEKKMGWSYGNAVRSWTAQLESIRALPDVEKRSVRAARKMDRMTILAAVSTVELLLIIILVLIVVGLLFGRGRW